MCELCELDINDLLYTLQVVKREFAFAQGHDVPTKLERHEFEEMRQQCSDKAFQFLEHINQQEQDIKDGLNGVAIATERATITFMRQLMLKREAKFLEEIKHLKASLDERLSNQSAYLKC